MKHDARIFVKRILALLGASLWLPSVMACTPLLPQGLVRGPQTYRVETNFHTGDFKRDYHLHIPTGYDGQQQLPLVVVVHGSMDTAKGVEKCTQFSALADRENFIVLYPNGIGILGYFQHWNAGHCCGKAAADNLDDVGFVASAIAATKNRFRVDVSKVFMIGFSNGGMFVHRFAAEKGALLAGAAALAGSICSRTQEGPAKWQMPQPEVALPMLVMHAEDDASVPFYGENSQRKGGPSAYCSVAQSVDFWRQNNLCAQSTKTQSLFRGAVELKQWTDCTSGHPVSLYAIKQWGHVWPGRYFTEKLAPDHPMKTFDAAEIAWQFFKTNAP